MVLRMLAKALTQSFASESRNFYVPMSAYWKRLIGQTVANRYRLRQMLASDGGSSFFLATTGEEGTAAIVHLMPDDPAELEMLERLHALSHPNLLAMLDCGQSEEDGE